jgi:hypothetical protein
LGIENSPFPVLTAAEVQRFSRRTVSPPSPRQGLRKRIESLSQHINIAMIQKLSRGNYEDFVRQKRAAAVHFFADWDVGYRPIARRRMSEASDVLVEHVNFGEVDWDHEVELAKSFRVLSVPTV